MGEEGPVATTLPPVRYPLSVLLLLLACFHAGAPIAGCVPDGAVASASAAPGARTTGAVVAAVAVPAPPTDPVVDRLLAAARADAGEGGLEPEEAVEGGGDADGAAAVGGERNRREAERDGYRATRGAAARAEVLVVEVAGHEEVGVDAGRRHAPFGAVCGGVEQCALGT